MKPKHEGLETKLVDTEAKLDELQRLLKIAIDRITALEGRINKNPSNSSKPPSTDQKPDSRGKKGSRKHRSEGYSRPSSSPDQIDHFIICSLEKCPCCFASFSLAKSDNYADTGGNR